jgi:hypothetical protein
MNLKYDEFCSHLHAIRVFFLFSFLDIFATFLFGKIQKKKKKIRLSNYFQQQKEKRSASFDAYYCI